ncbi:MAG: class I SAM-dependent methyltransferase [Nanoarchaeota archaeon]
MSPNVENYKDILLGLCKQLNVRHIAEVGLGPDAKTADYILSNYHMDSFVYYVIENNLNPIAVENLSKHQPTRYKIIQGHSQNQELYKNLPPIDIFCIDGDHAFWSCYGDLKTCAELNLLSETGVVLLHDSSAKQIQEAMEYTKLKHNFQYFNVVCSNFAIGRFNN